MITLKIVIYISDKFYNIIDIYIYIYIYITYFKNIVLAVDFNENVFRRLFFFHFHQTK